MFFFLFIVLPLIFFFFFFNDTATTEIYTLSLHDALPILLSVRAPQTRVPRPANERMQFTPIGLSVSCSPLVIGVTGLDRKSTRLNSSHSQISYAVFCLKKKKKRNSRCSSESTKNNTMYSH